MDKNIILAALNTKSNCNNKNVFSEIIKDDWFDGTEEELVKLAELRNSLVPYRNEIDGIPELGDDLFASSDYKLPDMVYTYTVDIRWKQNRYGNWPFHEWKQSKTLILRCGNYRYSEFYITLNNDGLFEIKDKMLLSGEKDGYKNQESHWKTLKLGKYKTKEEVKQIIIETLREYSMDDDTWYKDMYERAIKNSNRFDNEFLNKIFENNNIIH